MKAKLIPLGLIGLYIGIYFAILFPYNRLWFYILPTYTLGDSQILIANVVLETILVLLYGFIVIKTKKKSPLKVWNQAGISVVAVIAAFFTGIASGLYTVCFFKLPFTLDHFPMYNELLLQFFGQGAFIAFALFCITSSVFKEVLFRGLIMNELKVVMPISAAVVLQALLYGTANFYSTGIESVVFAAIGAVIFALIYFWTKNLWISIIAQFGDIIAICSLTMLKDSVINRTSSVYVLGPTIMGLLALCFYFYHLHRKRAGSAMVKEQDGAAVKEQDGVTVKEQGVVQG